MSRVATVSELGLRLPRPARDSIWTSMGRRGLAAALPTALVALHAVRYGQWIVDDAGISFAYARSLATGAGPVLQPGAARVEGFSNPAWTAILVVGHWLGTFDHGSWFGSPDLVLFPKLVALLCCFGMFCCFHAVVGAVRTQNVFVVSVAAGAATAAVPSFVIWTMSGLENSLLAFAVVAIAATLVRAARANRMFEVRTALMCGGLAALAALTRPDGLIYIAAYPIALLVLHREDGRRTARMLATSVAAAVVPVGIYVAWRLATFGSWLPNPAIAKRQGLPSLSDFNKPTDLIVSAGGLGSVFVVVFVVAALRRASTTRTALTMLLVPLGLAVVAYSALKTDWMAELRFSTPIWPLAALVFALSVAEVVERVDTRTRRASTAAILVIGLLTLHLWDQRSSAFAHHTTVSICAVARNTGYTFNTYADRLGIGDGSLLAVDGGGTSLTTRLRFVDLSGLGDKRIARYWADRDMTGLRDHVFDDVRPTFIRIWFGWDGIRPSGILDDARLQRDYVLIWSPPEGGGNWVRRAAVTDPSTLADLQQSAPQLAVAVDAPWARGATRWWCGPTLRPSAPGDDPVTKLPT